MSLPQFFRIRVVNKSGQTVTFNTNGRLSLMLFGLAIDPTTGLQTYTAIASSPDDLGFIAGQAFANLAERASDEIDNTTTKYTGLQVQLEVLHDDGAAAGGTFDMYLDSGIASGQLQSDHSGYGLTGEEHGLTSLGSLIWLAANSDDDIVLSNMTHI